MVMVADCKSVEFFHRRFDSYSPQSIHNYLYMDNDHVDDDDKDPGELVATLLGSEFQFDMDHYK